MVQSFLVTIFNSTTAEAALSKYTPTMVAAVEAAVHRALSTVPVGKLSPMDAMTCQIQRAHPWLGYLMLFLWYSMMLKQICDSLELVKMVVVWPVEKPKAAEKESKKVPKTKYAGEPDNMATQMGKGPDKVDHMKFPWKLFVLLFILGPHLLISFYVTIVGTRFLASTGDPGTLIMKAMALKFVLMFEKLFYAGFVSEQFQHYIKKAKYVFSRQPERNYWNSWLSTVFKLCVSLFLTGYTWISYTPLLQLRTACREYLEASPANCLGGSCGLELWR